MRCTYCAIANALLLTLPMWVENLSVLVVFAFLRTAALFNGNTNISTECIPIITHPSLLARLLAAS